MSGNVAEWCQDWSLIEEDYDYNSAQTNPNGPTWGYYHVYRGGDSNNFVQCCPTYWLCDDQNGNYYCIGLRLCLSE